MAFLPSFLLEDEVARARNSLKKSICCVLKATNIGDVEWDKVRVELAKIGFSGWVTREGNDGGADKTAALMDELLDL